MEDKAIKVVVSDPKTRDAVTYRFDTMEKMVVWAQEQIGAAKSAAKKPKNG